MRIKSLAREILSVELLLLWILKGTMGSFLSPSQNGVFKLNYQNSIITSHIVQLALVGLSMPWISSVDSVTVSNKKRKSKTVARRNSTTTTTSTTTTSTPSTTTSTKRGKRKSKNLPQKQTSANNALLANIDFLTHLTNTKQEENTEMDPLKCFPKALCGLSAESAAITRRRKNGLISDYIRLMKAVALNPSVMDKTLKKLKAHDQDQQQDDVPKDSGESDEDREDDEDEDEDDETEHRRESALKKRTNYGYGYGSSSLAKEPNVDDDGPAKKRTKRREIIPKNSDEFTKQFLAERAHVERLIEDGFYHEDTDDTNWWNFEKEKDPELEDLVDFSGGRLDSASGESYYTFGAKRKPQPPTPPEIPETPIVPPAPNVPHMGPLEAPPRLRPPKAPSVPALDSESSGTVSTIGRFFRSLFGFGSNGGQFTSDPFFSGFQRSLPDGTPTVVTVDKTKEILTTAIEIGETLRSPNQCNSLFNGCRYQYIELLHVIDDIRQSLAERGKDDFDSSPLDTGIDEENDSDAKAADTPSSYGYKSRLSETLQAETLSPDYGMAASAITRKNGRKKAKKSSYRGGAVSSVSRETSVEIGSDEPTMYGSAQENFDYYQNQYHRHGHSRERHHHNRDESHNHHYGSQQQPSYQFEDVHVRQPKSIWGTILSWFGFR